MFARVQISDAALLTRHDACPSSLQQMTPSSCELIQAYATRYLVQTSANTDKHFNRKSGIIIVSLFILTNTGRQVCRALFQIFTERAAINISEKIGSGLFREPDPTHIPTLFFNLLKPSGNFTYRQV
jgi:hypothetical protein